MNFTNGDRWKLVGSLMLIIIAVITLIYTTVYAPLSANTQAVAFDVKTECAKRESGDRDVRADIKDLSIKADRIIETQKIDGERLARIEGKIK